MNATITAPEYRSDGSFALAELSFDGSCETGWKLRRNGEPHLELGPGYTLIDVEQCGVCSTDLARAFLPFPLPQVTGHEILGRDEDDRRVVVEINASHRARGVGECQFCAKGLERHCPERLVVGIHDLPGGFGSKLLAPVNAVIPLPDEIPSAAGVLIEPLAASLNAVQMIAPTAGDRVMVLGPRRLGMLVVAALDAYREASGVQFEIIGAARHEHLRSLSREFGADEVIEVVGEGENHTEPVADVVIDTTGNPKGLELALRLANREVHLKSTHGQPALGLSHLTELVVDEMSITPFHAAALRNQRVAWLGADVVGSELQADVLRGSPDEIFECLKSDSTGIPRVDVAVVDSAQLVDRAIRPSTEHELSLVKPRGSVALMQGMETSGSSLLAAVTQRGLRLSSSRCGDFHAAIDLLSKNEGLREIGERLVTHHFSNADMNEVFAVARSPECIKAVVKI